MKILVGLSWGVDSAVSALILKRAGHEVHAGFMINYLTDDVDCTTRADLEVAREVAAFLEIPFFTFDYQDAYEARITSFIYDGYARGVTPNPDVLCNNLIKFELFAQDAREYGYDKIAMGHYARISEVGLLKWVDEEKDQSYFLSRLSPLQLSYALFPIGEFTKSQVRTLAEEAGLPNAGRRDSQGLCFIWKVKMQDFLEERLELNRGDIVSVDGQKLWTHEGIHRYTIGQRRGIELWGGPALFVICKDAENNTLVVGPESSIELYNTTCIGSQWSSPTNISLASLWEKIITWKLRYRQTDQVCRILSIDNRGFVEVEFDIAQRAISPGQYLVLYHGTILLGSLYIEDVSF